TLKYREIKAKQMEANLAKNLEQDRKGERFTLIDPAQRPIEPVSPNRIALLLVGLVLSVFGGLAAVAMLELMDASVRGEKALTEVLGGVAPISIIPYIENETDTDSQLKLQTRVKIALAVGAVVLLIFIHAFYKPLDVIWFILMNKLGLS
ncbi:MAG: lipopolysaccharide biosynthesis protein, partial [Pseudomonadales bacterium]